MLFIKSFLESFMAGKQQYFCNITTPINLFKKRFNVMSVSLRLKSSNKPNCGKLFWTCL